jgi:hypothetical protein
MRSSSSKSEVRFGFVFDGEMNGRLLIRFTRGVRRGRARTAWTCLPSLARSANVLWLINGLVYTVEGRRKRISPSIRTLIITKT